jgi:hypothetical protein
VVCSALYTNDAFLTPFALVNRAGLNGVAWTELNHTPVGSNDWVRLTVTMDYLSSPGGFFVREHFFRIALNGQMLSSPKAYLSTALQNDDGFFPIQAGASQTNAWFLCVDSGYGDESAANLPNNTFLSAVEFDGVGKVDDLVVGTSAPTFQSQSKYQQWIAGYTSSNNAPDADADYDGVSNFKEFVAGTSPTDPNDYFRITREIYSGTSNLVVWIGTTNSGNFSTYTVYRSTNLLTTVGGWVPVASNIARAASGTNAWLDLAPPTNAFYKPTLPTNTP